MPLCLSFLMCKMGWERALIIGLTSLGYYEKLKALISASHITSVKVFYYSFEESVGFVSDKFMSNPVSVSRT